MTKFNANDYGSVEYDFTKYQEGLKGIIPDPSDDLIQQYFKEMREFFRENGLDDLPSERDLRLNPSRIRELTERIEAIDKIEVHHSQLAIVAKLCQNTPSTEEMMKLPYRVRVRFIRYVQTELTSPED